MPKLLSTLLSGAACRSAYAGQHTLVLNSEVAPGKEMKEMCPAPMLDKNPISGSYNAEHLHKRFTQLAFHAKPHEAAWLRSRPTEAPDETLQLARPAGLRYITAVPHSPVHATTRLISQLHSFPVCGTAPSSTSRSSMIHVEGAVKGACDKHVVARVVLQSPHVLLVCLEGGHHLQTTSKKSGTS